MDGARKRLLVVFIIGLILSFNSVDISAQDGRRLYTISGVVKDSGSGEPLAGATIVAKGGRNTAKATDNEGRYSLRIEAGEYLIIVSYIGYEEKRIPVSVNGDLIQNISISSSAVGLKEVIVTGRAPDENVANVQTGAEKVSIVEINRLPVLMGERDIIKSIQLLPGVKSTGDGSSGMFIRGGNSGQNTILLDNIPLYNTSHAMGFFSTFNSDIIRSATLYKGAMPAQYGERLASAFDIQMVDGDTDNYNFYGGIGLISSRLSIDGPISKGKSSFVISGRRTYADLMAKLSGVDEAQGSSLYFYDLNLKMNFRLSEKDRLSVTGYRGNDVMGVKDFIDSGFGNLSGAVRWGRTITQKWSMNTTLIYNRYSSEIERKDDIKMKISSRIDDYILKQNFNYIHSPNSTWRFGYSSTYHIVSPGRFKYDETVGTDRILQDRYSWESGLYISNQLKLSENIELLYGLRLSVFSVLGKGDFYELDPNHNIIDTISYGSGEFVKNYFNLEPRISFLYKLDSSSSIKGSYGRTTQNMHLLSSAVMGGFMQRWTPSSNYIEPQIADQYTIGYFRNFNDNMYEFSVESYYKDMYNQVDFRDGAQTFRLDAIETELLFGKGRAYGIEFLLRKRTGKLTGWVGYTLSKSENKIDGINENRWYNTIQDRTHDISVIGMYDLGNRWSLSLAWVYSTGNAITYPSGKYIVNGLEVPYFTERNGYRAPAYHRLDVGATYSIKTTRRYSSELAIGVYNAYGRENPYMIDYRPDSDDPSKMVTYQISLFRFVPSISWNFKF